MNGIYVNQLLVNFIESLNNAVKVGENEYYNEDFDSDEFRAVDMTINDGVMAKITVLEDDYFDEGKSYYSYRFGLTPDDILLGIEDYDFDRDEVIAVIKNYSKKIKKFAENQKKELEKQLNDLTVFLIDINEGRFTK
jgi:hypothetical protein